MGGAVGMGGTVGAEPPPDAPIDSAGADAGADMPPLLAVGEACTGGDMCMTGFCVDKVCCASGCTDLCHACAASLTGKADGVCAITNAGADPRGQCPKDAVTSCHRTGVCDGAGACQLYAPGTTCAPPTCANAMLTGPATCDGAGSCHADSDPPADCPGNLVCESQTACKANCTCNGDCLRQTFCSGGACVPKHDAGAKCDATQSGADCKSGHCVDGVCCDSACVGSCMACTEVKTGHSDGECGVAKDNTTCGSYCCKEITVGGTFAARCEKVCNAGACVDSPNVANGSVLNDCRDNVDCTDDSCSEVGDDAFCHHAPNCKAASDCCCDRGDTASCHGAIECVRQGGACVAM